MKVFIVFMNDREVAAIGDEGLANGMLEILKGKERERMHQKGAHIPIVHWHIRELDLEAHTMATIGKLVDEIWKRRTNEN